MVNTTTCLKKNKITNRDLCYIIMQNYNKAQIITNSKSKDINYLNILQTHRFKKRKASDICFEYFSFNGYRL